MRGNVKAEVQEEGRWGRGLGESLLWPIGLEKLAPAGPAIAREEVVKASGTSTLGASSWLGG